MQRAPFPPRKFLTFVFARKCNCTATDLLYWLLEGLGIGISGEAPRWGLGARGLACALLSSILNTYVQEIVFIHERAQG